MVLLRLFVLCNYQSKRRCAKTSAFSKSEYVKCNYQSKRRCAKTQLTKH